VAVVIDWKNKAEYVEPRIFPKPAADDPVELNQREPSLEDCLKLFTAKVSLVRPETLGRTHLLQLRELQDAGEGGHAGADIKIA
jgi:hypothetical protein